MTKSIERYRVNIKQCGKRTGFCYLNTKLNQFLWTNKLIEETINVDHLIRQPDHDLIKNSYSIIERIRQ